jgi:hypothetical protein
MKGVLRDTSGDWRDHVKRYVFKMMRTVHIREGLALFQLCKGLKGDLSIQVFMFEI